MARITRNQDPITLSGILPNYCLNPGYPGTGGIADPDPKAVQSLVEPRPNSVGTDDDDRRLRIEPVRVFSGGNPLGGKHLDHLGVVD
jgi:hypothetical protein